MLLIAFALMYSSRNVAAEMTQFSVRVFREHDQWSNSSEKIPDEVIFKSSSLLPPNIAFCKGFGFACTNEPSHVIATYQRCDGIEQCPDGSDEVDCHRCQTTLSCGSYEIPMKCLRGSMICDGVQHCVDGADEKAFCKKDCEGRLKCNHSDICLLEGMICDGDVHCPDGEDEHECEECKNGAKMCKPSSMCIPKWQLCDGAFNCFDGSDELECDCKTCSGNGKVLCDGRVKMCLDNSRICDGKRDCHGGEDEEQCPGSCEVDIDCPEGEDQSNCEDCKNLDFQCAADNKIIASTKRCDGIEDCSDELNCSCKECMLHPLKMYMCSSGSRCFRLNDVCSPYSKCPDADERDKLYCALRQGGRRFYL